MYALEFRIKNAPACMLEDKLILGCELYYSSGERVEATVFGCFKRLSLFMRERWLSFGESAYELTVGAARRRALLIFPTHSVVELGL